MSSSMKSWAGSRGRRGGGGLGLALELPYVALDDPAVALGDLLAVGGHQALAEADDVEDAAVRQPAGVLGGERRRAWKLSRHQAVAQPLVAVAGGAPALKADLAPLLDQRAVRDRVGQLAPGARRLVGARPEVKRLVPARHRSP